MVKKHITTLSEYDRKVLNKYARLYTNYIESPTAKPAESIYQNYTSGE